MRPTIVILVVGLSPRHIGPDTPHISALARAGAMRPLSAVTPAVTCTAQATFMTGSLPREHGIVANGWLFRDQMEVWLWRQSNRLVGGEKIWEAGKRRDAAFTCANMFWWYNMAATHDVGVTPRPIYRADGRKLPDCYTKPLELRDELTDRLGTFPLFNFWGPATSIKSSRWIADAALHVRHTRVPTLTLVYLPHLDYDLQRLGPYDPRLASSLREVDAVAGVLIADAERDGARVIVLSEYGITPVSRPVHINRVLREAGLLKVRREGDGELLDPVQSEAFAVSDHQIAHIYVANPRLIVEVNRIVSEIPGVDCVLDRGGQERFGIDHPRSGELVALARADAWFTYYYWLDDVRAPDFARLVEIHRKPGYDPVELFIDPAINFPKVAVGWRLARRALGFTTLMDVIPLDASLVKGSHGRVTVDADDGPVFVSSEKRLTPDGPVAATAVKSLILSHVFDEPQV
ncbi:nucleotide pyrophosphatase/phosphodiesterase family protein [Bradyrhizobium sp. 45]|uniref:nucleotide pyrophosphatase/phosphodiesterase family protein n=1 Tax=Bradyrhizobium sp. 45 TaxID=1043587 RepID=UPI001FF7AD64|nr:nucleotide pyrophosphatase/phosphodiesterase family protein [Bradyrhizobium sp. 45]MCK1307644.1 alkaline phosphatase family protein [Bradyrhizobium sp. 45]